MTGTTSPRRCSGAFTECRQLNAECMTHCGGTRKAQSTSTRDAMATTPCHSKPARFGGHSYEERSMFKRLLARLFGRKPAPATTSTKVVPPVIGVVTGYQPRAAATPSHPPRKPSQGNGTNVNARVVGMNVRQERRDDISDPLHPLNPLNPLSPASPVFYDATTLGDDHRRETMAFGGSDHHHHHHSSSSHDSCSYDSGSYDSGSSSSSCD